MMSLNFLLAKKNGMNLFDNEISVTTPYQPVLHNPLARPQIKL